jgi:hypothetical protein
LISLANLGVTTVTWTQNGVGAKTIQTFVIDVSNATTTYVGTVVNGDANYVSPAVKKFNNLTSTVADTNGALFAPAGTVGSFAPQAQFFVHQLNSAGGLVAASSTNAITATLTGPGSVSINTLPNPTSAGSVGYVVLAAKSANEASVDVWSDGRTGVSTLTIAVNGVVVATKTINFYGAVATLTPTPILNVIKNGGTTTTNVSAVVAKDANGTTIPLPSGVLTVTNTGGATLTTVNHQGDGSLSTGTGSFEALIDVTTSPLSKSGDKAVFTASYMLSNGTWINSAAWTVALGGSVAKETISLDAASYSAGAPMTLTATAVDASGNPVYDGATGATLSSNKIAAAALPAITYASGKFTSKANSVFAPITPGDFTIFATGADSAATKYTVNATVANEAADAASLATDAANAATDAANAAAESADNATQAASDALAAVQALQSYVSKLFAAVKKQIYALLTIVKKK